MTNAEYFEKNNISFSVSMKLFNKSNCKTFDEFLKATWNNNKFKIGDIVVLQLNDYTLNRNWENNVVFKIINVGDENYYVKFLTPTKITDIGDCREFPIEFIDDNCEIY